MRATAGGTIVTIGNWKPTPIQMHNLNVNPLDPPGGGHRAKLPQCHQVRKRGLVWVDIS